MPRRTPSRATKRRSTASCEFPSPRLAVRRHSAMGRCAQVLLPSAGRPATAYNQRRPARRLQPAGALRLLPPPSALLAKSVAAIGVTGQASGDRRTGLRSSWWLSAWPERTPWKWPRIGAAGEIEVAERVEHLVAHELVVVAQAFLVQHRSPLMTMAFSSEPPRARPAWRSARPRRRKPKVRARLISVLKLLDVEIELNSWWRIAPEAKSIVEARGGSRRPGNNAAELPLTPTRTGFSTLMPRRGAIARRCRRIRSGTRKARRCRPSPALRVRRARPAALSIPRPANAAIRCSIVAI